MIKKFEFTDRYKELGIPYPQQETMCKDQCEGTGVVPIQLGTSVSGDEEPWKSLWLAAEEKKPSEDGWHFVVCPSCSGTGKKL